MEKWTYRGIFSVLLMSFVRVTRKGQVTLPKKLRDMLEIREGDLLLVGVEGNRIVLIKGEIPSPGEPVGEDEYSKLIEELEGERAKW